MFKFPFKHQRNESSLGKYSLQSDIFRLEGCSLWLHLVRHCHVLDILSDQTYTNVLCSEI